MNRSAPVISVALCTFNGERYLEEQLDSIAAQSRPPDELVICDDASTDASVAISEVLASHADFPVRIHVNERNLGSTRNFDRAIGLCAGDLIVLSDQDDVWRSDKLQVLEAAFDQHPEVGLAFSDADLVDEDTHPLGRTLWEQLQLDAAEIELLQSPGAFALLLAGSTVAGATLAFRGCFKDLVLPMPDDLPIIHDGWIAALVSATARVLPLAEPLIQYRQHPGQQNGGRERVRPAPGLTAALRRESTYDELLAVGGRVQERLAACSARYDSRTASQELQARLAHMRARRHLPTRVLPRTATVVTELLAGRYHAHSNGLRSAAKDLLHLS
jgi:hypothetical protein